MRTYAVQTPRRLFPRISSGAQSRLPSLHESSSLRLGMSDALVIPDNITLLPLPPRSPELNPQENIWQFMRDNWLSNIVFKSYDDIVEYCCEAWNKLVDQPWLIMSIGLREWAYR